MKTRMLLTALALVAITAAAGVAADTTEAKPHAPIAPRLDWALAIAKEMNIPVIVDFYADW
jgi:thiol:disulfide interchange protein